MHPCPGNWIGDRACDRVLCPVMPTHLVQESNGTVYSQINPSSHLKSRTFDDPSVLERRLDSNRFYFKYHLERIINVKRLFPQ